MKNEKIVQAFDKTAPPKETTARIYYKIQNAKRAQVVSVPERRKRPVLRLAATLAACVALVAMISAVGYAAYQKWSLPAPETYTPPENGGVIEITKKSIKCEETVPAGAILVDGTGVGEVGSVVLRDRHKLAEDGMVVVVLPYSTLDHRLLSEPQIITRGFIYVKEAEELMEELKRVAIESTDACAAQHITDWTAIKNRVKNNLSGYLYKSTRRSPMILPVITEI